MNKKNLFPFVFLVLAIITSVSCGKLGGAAVSLKTAGELKITSAGGYQSIGFTAKSDWTASSSVAWCTVSPSSGSAGDNLTVTALIEGNTGMDERKCNVVIRCGDASETVSIVQDALGTLTAEKLNYEIDFKEQKVEVDLKTNIEYVVDVPSTYAGWVSVESTKALHSGKIVFAVKENPNPETRNAYIDVHAAPGVQSTGNASFTVRISQGPKAYLTVKEKNVALPCGATYGYLNIETNGEPEVTAEEAEWYGINDSGSASEHYWTTYFFKPNSTPQDRTMKVIVSLKGAPEFSHEVTYTQHGTEEVVDMGVSVKWRSFNLGTTSLEENGSFFAWGETEPKTEYNWSTYKWSEGETNTLTKYCYTEAQGAVDNKLRLDLEDDAARTILGGKWRIPTGDEFMELVRNCTIEYVIIEKLNIRGFNFVSKVSGYEDKSLFFKSNGSYNNTAYNDWSMPWLWTSDIHQATDASTDGLLSRYATIYSGGNGDTYEDCLSPKVRYQGLPIRPVQDK